MRVIITAADRGSGVADYVEHVAARLAEGFTSGHEDPEHHWTTEED